MTDRERLGSRIGALRNAIWRHAQRVLQMSRAEGCREMSTVGSPFDGRVTHLPRVREIWRRRVYELPVRGLSITGTFSFAAEWQRCLIYV